MDKYQLLSIQNAFIFLQDTYVFQFFMLFEKNTTVISYQITETGLKYY